MRAIADSIMKLRNIILSRKKRDREFKKIMGNNLEHVYNFVATNRSQLYLMLQANRMDWLATYSPLYFLAKDTIDRNNFVVLKGLFNLNEDDHFFHSKSVQLNLQESHKYHIIQRLYRQKHALLLLFL